ncbi:MAG: periplasmic heavy metal sensor [Gammaproteobacteria bacterium]|nr:periplasmic heavy metal sensor [Gammaproteobacteria bacterium]MCP5424869.1 periplasmic heavy metal sensor [Gammaproteobacteria bacterium]MCP5458154.1 periplasmic heavy metal sensor [Gammaproteobacteria bacterium]
MQYPLLLPTTLRAWLITGLTGLLLATTLSLEAWGNTPLPKPAERLLRQISQLHDELGLSASQDTLWQNAQTQTRQQIRQMIDRHQQLRQALQSALEHPDLDLRALALQADQMQTQNTATRKQIRDTWLVVYDGLDNGQRERVRLFLGDRLQRVEHFRDRFRLWLDNDQSVL